MTRIDVQRLLVIVALAFLAPAADLLHTVSKTAAGLPPVDPRAMAGLFAQAPGGQAAPVAEWVHQPGTVELASLPRPLPAAAGPGARIRLIVRPAAAVLRSLPWGRTRIWISRS